MLDRKNTADRIWDRLFDQIGKVPVDLGAIGSAMHMCNMCDKNLIDFERTESEIKRSMMGLSDIDGHGE